LPKEARVVNANAKILRTIRVLVLSQIQQEEMKTWLLYIIIGMLSAGLVISLIWKPKYQEPQSEVITQVVTVTKTDTLIYYLPKYITERYVRVDTLFVRDTILVEVPITQREYQDSTYHAYISGYKPNLDSIEVFQRTMIVNTITTEKVVVNGSKWVITAGLNVGVGYVAPFSSGAGTIGMYTGIGVGLGYRF